MNAQTAINFLAASASLDDRATAMVAQEEKGRAGRAVTKSLRDAKSNATANTMEYLDACANLDKAADREAADLEATIRAASPEALARVFGRCMNTGVNRNGNKTVSMDADLIKVLAGHSGVRGLNKAGDKVTFTHGYHNDEAAFMTFIFSAKEAGRDFIRRMTRL